MNALVVMSPTEVIHAGNYKIATEVHRIADEEIQGRSLNALIIEPSYELRQLLKVMLDLLGYSALIVSDRASASARVRDKKPDGTAKFDLSMGSDWPLTLGNAIVVNDLSGCAKAA